MKRQAEETSLESSAGKPSSPKKQKKSSNVSSTCERLGSILLSRSDGERPLNATSADVFGRSETFSEELDSNLSSPAEHPGKPKQATYILEGMSFREPKQALKMRGSSPGKPEQLNKPSSRKPSK